MNVRNDSSIEQLELRCQSLNVSQSISGLRSVAVCNHSVQRKGSKVSTNQQDSAETHESTPIREVLGRNVDWKQPRRTQTAAPALVKWLSQSFWWKCQPGLDVRARSIRDILISLLLSLWMLSYFFLLTIKKIRLDCSPRLRNAFLIPLPF